MIVVSRIDMIAPTITTAATAMSERSRRSEVLDMREEVAAGGLPGARATRIVSTLMTSGPERATDRPAAAPSDDPATDELAEQLRQLFRATRRLRGYGNQHQGGGLSLPQYHLLEPLLRCEAELPVGQLAERAGLSPPTATTMIRKLVDQGIVERRPDPSDRRVVRLALSPAGRERVAERRDVVEGWRTAIARRVDAADRAAGVRVLAAVVAGLEETADALAALVEEEARAGGGERDATER
jgi:DNA-binding MarR family transcriptional regulator